MDWQKRRLLILVALLCAWGLTFAFRWPWNAPARLMASGNTPGPPRTPTAQGGGLPRLKTGLLHLPVPAYPSDVQNIFGTHTPPPRPVEAAAPPPAPPPPDPFQEEAKRLRYLGFLQAGNTVMAFIAQGPEVHTLGIGDTLGGRFRVQAVTEDAVLLSSPSGDGQVRLPLAAEAGPPPKR